MLALGIAILAWLVLLATSWNLGVPKDRFFLPSPFAEDPAATFDHAMDELKATRGASLASSLGAINEAAALDPLDGRPLFFHAFGKLLRDPAHPPIALLEAARARDPRLRETRLLLLDGYGRTGRSALAMREAQVLTDLMRSEKATLVQLVAGLAEREEGRATLAEALPSSLIKGPVMQRLAQTGVPLSTLEALASPMRGLAHNPAEQAWIGAFLTSIAKRPDPEGARQLWAIFEDEKPDGAGGRIADTGFDGVAGTPPFAWAISSSSAGAAKIENRALDILFYGRNGGIFARKLLMLLPGRYRLSSSVSASGAEAASALSWQLACLESGKGLYRARLSQFLAGAGPGDDSFTVPASGCAAQWLELVGTPEDVPTTQSVKIDRVAIDGVGTP
jgi:hypothetical protein